jgi:hypothetical protein
MLQSGFLETQVKQNHSLVLVGIQISPQERIFRNVDENIRRLVELAEQQNKWTYVNTALGILAIVATLLKK